MIVNEFVLAYELEKSVSSPRMSASVLGLPTRAELLLRVARVDLTAAVTLEDDAMNRVHALVVALHVDGAP